MSRSGYSDDYGDDYPNQLELYRANVARSIKSKKGQARLRELRDALKAMSEKALEAETFMAPTGEACALGVWAREKLAREEALRQELEAFDGNDEETFELLAPHGWPKLVIYDLIYENDRDGYVNEQHLGPHKYPGAYWRSAGPWPLNVSREETAEERYARVLKWIEARIEEAS